MRCSVPLAGDAGGNGGCSRGAVDEEEAPSRAGAVGAFVFFFFGDAAGAFVHLRDVKFEGGTSWLGSDHSAKVVRFAKMV